jgi:hypothetical protein
MRTCDEITQKPCQIIMEYPAEEGKELSEVCCNASACWEQASQPVLGRHLFLEEGAVIEEGGIVQAVLGVDTEEPLDAVASRALSHGCDAGMCCG